MKKAADELERQREKESKENMRDLMNKLNLYQAQSKERGARSIKHSKENSVFAANIKLNKDQKDEIVAKSLQIGETMQKVLGSRQ